MRTDAKVVELSGKRPFAARDHETAKAFCVGMLKAPLGRDGAKALMGFRTPMDDFATEDREIYWLCQTGAERFNLLERQVRENPQGSVHISQASTRWFGWLRNTRRGDHFRRGRWRDSRGALAGALRPSIAADAARARDIRSALAPIRESMRTHRWNAGGERHDLSGFVGVFDRRTREDGFHALHDWDGVTVRVNPESIPVDVLDYLVKERGTDPSEPAVVGVLVDYYFLYVLGLLSLRVWDSGDPNINLDRVSRLCASDSRPAGQRPPICR